MSDFCKNPAPNLTAQYFLNKIVCILNRVLGVKASTLRTVEAAATPTALPDVAGYMVSVLNSTGEDLVISYAADSSNSITIADGATVGLRIRSNASEIMASNASGTGDFYLVID